MDQSTGTTFLLLLITSGLAAGNVTTGRSPPPPPTTTTTTTTPTTTTPPPPTTTTPPATPPTTPPPPATPPPPTTTTPPATPPTTPPTAPPPSTSKPSPSTPSPSKPKSQFPVVPVAAGGGALIASMLLAIACLLVCRRKRNSASHKSPDPELPPETTRRHRNRKDKFINKTLTRPPFTGFDASIAVDVTDPDYINEAFDPPVDEFRELVINEADLMDVVKKMKLNDGFVKEFKKIPATNRFPVTLATQKKLQNKNRFIDIYPYDTNRVEVTQVDGDPEDNYINASYIDGFQRKKAYIAAQGPLESTLDDWWRMIWEQDVRCVIMLANIIEDGRVRCDKYWPDLGRTKSYSQLKVRNDTESVRAEYVVRKLEVTAKDGECRVVTQFHFTAWPDRGAPGSGTTLMELRQETLEIPGMRDAGPILTHCSAGIGRTGTYITLDYMVQLLEKTKQINVASFVNNLRNQRFNMVQTAVQYEFIYVTMLEWATFGSTTIKTSNFLRDFKKIPPQSYQLQFQVLQGLREVDQQNEERTIGLIDENKTKNRRPDVIPLWSTRVILMSLASGSKRTESIRLSDYANIVMHGANDYINAVYVDSYNIRAKFIVTQAPLPNTKMDFWRMICEYGVTKIISLNTPDEVEPEARYWPAEVDETCDEFRPIKVRLEQISAEERTIRRKFKVFCKKQVSELTQVSVKVPLGKLDKETFFKTLLDCYEEVKEVNNNTNNNKRPSKVIPTVVHCQYGVEWSGFFCVLSSLLDMSNIRHEVDVYQAVKFLRYSRTQFIVDLEQYTKLYEGIASYLSNQASIYRDVC